MVNRTLSYEEDYNQLKARLVELRQFSKQTGIPLDDELAKLEAKLDNLKAARYQHLTPWEKVLLCRQTERPTALDYINGIFDEWKELHGDRLYRDDPALVGGIGLIEGRAVTFLGHQKGRDTKDNLYRNFGMPHPEGYRKAERLVRQAEKFGRPIITLVNTPGAYPGIGAEERGQGQAIASMLMLLARVKVPVIAVITGEGGSGGALALAVGDRLLMFSNAVFSVASPEACSSILWGDPGKVEEMATAMKMTAPELKEMGLVDEIIEEPLGGAQKDLELMITRLKSSLLSCLDELAPKDAAELVAERYIRLMKRGRYLK